MKIQSFSPTPNFNVSRPSAGASQPVQADAFQPNNLPSPQDLIPNRFIQNNKGGDGGRMALQMAGIGVMFGGILASVNLPSSWVGVGIIGSMAGGVALMSLANR